MGTRSLTRVIPRQKGLPYDEGHKHVEKSVVNMYRHYDGYPQGHGLDLAEFLSEFTILRAGFLTDNSWAAFFMLVMLIIIFCAFMKHFFAMYQGEPNIPTKAKNFKLSGWHFFPMLIALSALFVFGFWWPEGFWNYFVNTANFLGAK